MFLNKGIHRTPSLAADGELDYMMNLLPSGGDIRNLPPAVPLPFMLDEGDILLGVHHVDGEKHYVVRNADGKSLAFYNQEGTARTPITTLTDGRVDGMVVMGNVLVVRLAGYQEGDLPNQSDLSFDFSTAYVIWREGTYAFLGTTFPQVDIQFRLRNIYVQTFNPGEETGIVIESSDRTETTEFEEVVAPTPVTTPEFSHETLFNITPAQPLEKATTYKIVTTRVTGKQATPFSVYICHTDSTRVYAAFSTAANDLHPFALFTTDATKTVDHLELVLWANGRQTKSLTVTLLKGTATATGHIFADTPENFMAITGMANAFISKYATLENKFMYPFFVRYALKMYDGTYVCPSPPCLMLPNRGLTPMVWTLGGTDGRPWDTYVSAVVSQLKYRLLRLSGVDVWKDLVTDVAIAVSLPVWSYNQGAEWKAGENLVRLRRVDTDDERRADDTWSYGYFDNGDGTSSATWLFRQNNSLSTTEAENLLTISLPSFSHQQQSENLMQCANFYIVKEIPLDQLAETGVWEDVEMDANTLLTLENRRQLPDNPLTLSPRSGACMTVYNGRLVIADVTDRKFQGHQPVLLQGMSGTYVNSSSQRATLNLTKAIVRYVEDGAAYTLCVSDQSRLTNEAPFFWFYYPSVNAQSVTLWQNDLTNRWRRAELRLRPHSLLSGAFWFDNFNEPEWTDWMTHDSLSEEWKAEADLADTNVTVRYANKLHQSGVGNPFAFSVELTNRVGETAVLGMAAATQALSQGQFGQFPLYAFCRDGIWVLSLADNGSFEAVHPVSRDRCLSANGMAQTDRAVVFATEQGLKIINGAEIRLLAAQLDGMAADVSLLSGVDTAFDQMVVSLPQDFKQTLQAATIAFDYPSDLLHLYVGSSDFHYVISLANGEVTLSNELNRPEAVVNDYPDTLIQQEGRIFRFSNACSLNRRKGILLTRPLSLGSLTKLKRMNDLRTVWRQYDPDSSVRVAVFASNNRRVWWRMRSLKGHSYRWFRIALFSEINDYERLEQLLVE